jgi:hypothetical protein
MAELHHRLLLEHDYAIINPLQVESALWSDLPTTPLVPKQVGARPELMPRLLRLQDMSDDAKTGLLARAQRHEKFSRHPFLSALLVADVDSPGLAAHISLRLILRTPDGGNAFFRYFDPRVFRHLSWLLTETQMNLLLGPVTHWSWRNMAGAWQQHMRVDVPSLLSGLRLTPEQWDSLQRLGLLNKSLRQIERSAPGIAIDDRSARRVDTLLRDAYEQHRLTDEADRRLYAEQAFRFHRHIHRHPQLVERLARASEGRESYLGACRDLDVAKLRQFATELDQPPRTMLK